MGKKNKKLLLNNKQLLSLLILGQGKTAQSASFFCDQMKIEYVAYDPNIDSQLGMINSQQILYQCPSDECMKAFDAVIATPGIPAEAEIYQMAQKNNIPIISDLDLFFLSTNKKIYSVTGSNGKSTTVKMIEFLHRSQAINIVIGGNYGIPALELLKYQATINVIEVSTFQAEFMSLFHSEISILLNIVENHLDRHKTINKYIALKERIFLRSEIGIYNFDDNRARDLGKKHKNSIPFSTKKKLDNGYFTQHIDHELSVYFNTNLVANLEIGNIKSSHDLSNFTAAFAAFHNNFNNQILPFGLLNDWKGLEHRFETVIETKEITVINDSKSTNIYSTISALENSVKEVILILGGKDKKQDFNKLVEACIGKAKTVIAYGETANDIYIAFHKKMNCLMVASLEEAVTESIKHLTKKEIILFSPGCSSQDMFKDFEERGRKFKALVWDKVA